MGVRSTRVSPDGTTVFTDYTDTQSTVALSSSLLDLIHQIAVTAVVLELGDGGSRRYERIDHPNDNKETN